VSPGRVRGRSGGPATQPEDCAARLPDHYGPRRTGFLGQIPGRRRRHDRVSVSWTPEGSRVHGIRARGRNPERLDGDWVRNPQVRIEFEPIESKKISITGAVKTPGELKFAGELRVFDALVKAGMTTADAGDEVLVVRLAPPRDGQTPAETEVISLSLRGIEKGDPDSNIALKDGDHIRVSKGQLVTITGQVRSPGAYAATPGMTVRQALALAGDVTEKGTHRGLKILRRTPGKPEPEEIKNVKLEDIVQPGDTIIVARRIM